MVFQLTLINLTGELHERKFLKNIAQIFKCRLYICTLIKTTILLIYYLHINILLQLELCGD